MIEMVSSDSTFGTGCVLGGLVGFFVASLLAIAIAGTPERPLEIPHKWEWGTYYRMPWNGGTVISLGEPIAPGFVRYEYVDRNEPTGWNAVRLEEIALHGERLRRIDVH